MEGILYIVFEAPEEDEIIAQATKQQKLYSAKVTLGCFVPLPVVTGEHKVASTSGSVALPVRAAQHLE